jgi:hypothetical protein
MTSRKLAAINRKTRIAQMLRDHPEMSKGQIAAAVGGCGGKYVWKIAKALGLTTSKPT